MITKRSLISLGKGFGHCAQCIGEPPTAALWIRVPLLVLAVLGVVARPECATADVETADPPSRVARLSYLQGEVSLHPAGTEDWTTAPINRPLTTGDELWVDRNSRAELQLGSAVIHLDEGTGFSFLDLNDLAVQMRVTEGAVNVRVRSLDDNESVEIDTPNAAISLLQAGEYRIDVAPSGDQTTVAVRDGLSEVSGDGEVFTIHAGERSTYTGSNRLAEHREPAGARDEFDAWASERDKRMEQSAGAQYVAPEVVGYEDLNEYGYWASVPEYGYVWYPSTVVIGWSPYRYGHWVWIGPWGWTWIDAAPWGFAPFHYGRWAYVNARWCWVPGPARVRPVYAPALVGWVHRPGYNPNVGGHDRVGWFPLGPRDVYVPGHHVSEHYIHRINATNTRFVDPGRVTQIYRTPRGDYRDQWSNRGTPNAISAVSRQTFVNAQPVWRHLIPSNEQELARAPVSTAMPNIAPGRSSVIGAANAVNVARPMLSRQAREVVVRRAPPVAPPAFALQQRAMEANGGRMSQPDFTGQRETSARTDTRVRSALPGGIIHSVSPPLAVPTMRAVQPQSVPSPGGAQVPRPATAAPTVAPPAPESTQEAEHIAPPTRTYRSEPESRSPQQALPQAEPRLHENAPWRTERVMPPSAAPAAHPPEPPQPPPARPPEHLYENRAVAPPRAMTPPRVIEAPPHAVSPPHPVEHFASPNHAPPPSPAAPHPSHAPGGHIGANDAGSRR